MTIYKTKTAEFWLERLAVKKNDEWIKLPPIEFRILICLSNSKEPLSRNQIVEAIGDRPYLSPRMVDTHISHLRKALGHDTIITIHKSGYQWIGVRS